VVRGADQRGCDRSVRPKRKAIPVKTKAWIMEDQRNCCAMCFDSLLDRKAEFDHRPPLVMRPVNAAGTDYDPPQLSKFHIRALCVLCHQACTTGRKVGAERTATTKGSDVWLAKKFRRLEGEPRKKAKIPQRKNPWPKRKFQK